MEPYELNWVYPRKMNSVEASAEVPVDIIITIGKGKANQPFTVIMHFRNFSAKKLAPTNRIQFAVSGDRIYFKCAHENDPGYKLTDAGRPDRRVCSFGADIFNLPKDQLAGSYSLHFDKNRHLNFIRLDKKL